MRDLYVCTHSLLKTCADLNKAFKHDEYYQLLMHRPPAPTPASVRTRDSPMRVRPSGRVHNRSVYGRRWVPETQAVFVGDLPSDVVEGEIRDVLSTYGRVQSVDILRRDVENGKHRLLATTIIANFGLGSDVKVFAFVAFDNTQSVEDALNADVSRSL